MADGGLLLIFRGMTTEKLLEIQAKMVEQFVAMGPYASQAVGQKSFSKDTSRSGLQAQLEAIQFVLNERGAPGPYAGFMISDFSNVDSSGSRGQPAGTYDQLSY
jgi:hypothetical protein